ncbi:IS701 family transposase [Kitasatospora sp. NPDC057198]|uniref:IS701 family transposase n=1 Tax=Kitasatospora sp. NPDC057198 TaxID=3346046 RepID=UPI00363DA9B4
MISNLRAPRGGPRPDGVSAYCHDLFHHFARSDQRRWGEVYLRGLRRAGGRRTPANISEEVLGRRLVQPIQQFVNQSPWESGDVRRRLAELVTAAAAPQAWVVDDVVFAKNGTSSVGVARQFVPAAGRIVNCQLALATSLVHPHGAQPVTWRLLLPPQWDADPELRARAHLPAEARHLPRWQHLLDSVDEVTGWEVPTAPVLADWSGEPEVEPLLLGLEERGPGYLVEVGADTALPARDRRARPVLPGVRPAPRTSAVVHRRAAELADELAPQGDRAVLAWRRGPADRVRHSQFLVLPLSDGHAPRPGRSAGAPAAPRRLVVEWPFGRPRPRTYWVTNLPAHRLPDLVALAELRGRSADTVERLHRNYGLGDFEGRSYRGWHHHVTLVAAAHGYDLLGRLRRLAAPEPARPVSATG